MPGPAAPKTGQDQGDWPRTGRRPVALSPPVSLDPASRSPHYSAESAVPGADQTAPAVARARLGNQTDRPASGTRRSGLSAAVFSAWPAAGTARPASDLSQGGYEPASGLSPGALGARLQSPGRNAVAGLGAVVPPGGGPSRAAAALRWGEGFPGTVQAARDSPLLRRATGGAAERSLLSQGERCRFVGGGREGPAASDGFADGPASGLVGPASGTSGREGPASGRRAAGARPERSRPQDLVSQAHNRVSRPHLALSVELLPVEARTVSAPSCR